MKIDKQLLTAVTRAQYQAIVRYIGNNPARFAELVNVFLAGPYRLTQRAARPLSMCCETHPTLIYPHLKQILRLAGQQGAHAAVKRNVMRLLQFITIPPAHRGTVVQLGFQFFENRTEPIAIRVFAMTVLAQLSVFLPELKNDLIPLIEDELPMGSAAFVSRGRKVLKQLKANLPT